MIIMLIISGNKKEESSMQRERKRKKERKGRQQGIQMRLIDKATIKPNMWENRNRSTILGGFQIQNTILNNTIRQLLWVPRISSCI